MNAPRPGFDSVESKKALEAFYEDHFPAPPDDKTKTTTELGKGTGKLRLVVVSEKDKASGAVTDLYLAILHENEGAVRVLIERGAKAIPNHNIPFHPLIEALANKGLSKEIKNTLIEKYLTEGGKVRLLYENAVDSIREILMENEAFKKAHSE